MHRGKFVWHVRLPYQAVLPCCGSKAVGPAGWAGPSCRECDCCVEIRQLSCLEQYPRYHTHDKPHKFAQCHGGADWMVWTGRTQWACRLQTFGHVTVSPFLCHATLHGSAGMQAALQCADNRQFLRWHCSTTPAFAVCGSIRPAGWQHAGHV